MKTEFIRPGGMYTMDYKDAAKLVNVIKPKLAIPTHYGSVAGSPQDGQRFEKLVDRQIMSIWNFPGIRQPAMPLIMRLTMQYFRLP